MLEQVTSNPDRKKVSFPVCAMVMELPVAGV